MGEKLAPVGVEHHNRVLRRAEKRALELEEKLVAILAPIVERAGHVAAANFEAFATDHLTAAGEPEFCLPAELRGKTDPVRQAVAKTVMGTALEEAGLSFDVTNPFAAKVLNQAASQVTHISETTRDDVMKVIRISYDQGYSIPDTAKAIRAYMEEASPARARLIARTELAGAVNGASLAATQIVARATGETYYKQWLTAPGARYPRHEDYEGLDHQTTTLDGYFDVGGYDLQHPGDPDGPPGEIANCRCALIYVTEAQDLAASAIPRENEEPPDVESFLATAGFTAAAEPPKWTPPAASEILSTDCVGRTPSNEGMLARFASAARPGEDPSTFFGGEANAGEFWAEENGLDLYTLAGGDPELEARIDEALRSWEQGYTSEPATTEVLIPAMRGVDGIRDDVVVWRGVRHDLAGVETPEGLSSASLRRDDALNYADPTGGRDPARLMEVLLPAGSRVLYTAGEWEVILPVGTKYERVSGNRFIAQLPRAFKADWATPISEATSSLPGAEAIKVGDEAAKSWVASLSDAEKQAIVQYVSQGSHQDINLFLRTGSAALGRSLSVNDISVLQRLRSAIAKSPGAPADLLLQRRTTDEDLRALLGLNPSQPFSEAIGKTVSDRAFLSTSVSQTYVGRYTHVLEIAAPKGTPGAYLGELGGFSEREFLLPEQTKLEITGAREQSGSQVVTAKVVSVPPQYQADIGITPFRAGEDNVVGFYDSSKFQQFTQDVERSAQEFGVTVDQQERVTGIWQGETEPSVSLQVHDGELGVRAMAADLGRAYNQDGVLLFAPGKEGDLIATFEKVLPQPQVFEAMQQVGLDGGRFTTDGKLQVIGGGPEFTAQLDRLASLLGSPYNAGVGQFGILEREAGDYDKALGDFASAEGKQVVPRGYGSEGDPGVAVAGQVAPGGQEGAEALQLERFPAGSVPQGLMDETLDWPPEAQGVAVGAIQNAARKELSNKGNELLTLRASDGKLRALANILTLDKNVIVEYLAASPGGGSGTALLRRIAGEAASQGKGLRIAATQDAISYYERFPQFIKEAENKFYMPPDRVAEFAKGGEPFRIVEPASPEVGDVAATNEGVREELTKGCDGEGLTSAAAPSYCLPAFVKSIGGEIVSEPGSDRAALAEQLNRYADTHPLATTTGDVIDAQIPTYEIRTLDSIDELKAKVYDRLHDLVLVEEFVLSEIPVTRLDSFKMLFKRKDGRLRFMLHFNQEPLATEEDARAFIQRQTAKPSLSQPQQQQQALEYPSGTPTLAAARKKEQQQLPRALAARLDQPPEAQQVTYVGVPASAGSVSVAGLVRTYMLGDRAVIERLVRGGSWVVDTSENTLRLIDEGAQVSPWFAAVLYDSLRSVV